jgi:tetratricopeptide (TPR) repeat protein
MKKVVIFFSVLFYFFISFADSSEDSLLSIANKTDDKNKKAQVYFELGDKLIKEGDYKKGEKYLLLSHNEIPYDYENNISILIRLAYSSILQHNHKKAQRLLNKVNKLLEKKNTSKLLLDFNNMRAYYYFSMQNIDSAKYFFKKTVHFAKLANDSAKYASNLNNLSVCYYYLGKVDSALVYSKKALEIKLRIDSLNYKGLAKAYLNIASYYDILAIYDEAVNYFLKGINFAIKSRDKYTMATLYNDLASTFKHMKNYEKAIYYYKKALSDIESIDNDRMKATILNNIGTCYINLNENKKAEKYLQKSLALYKEINLGAGMSASYDNLGNLFLKEKEFKKARKYFEKALRISQEYKDYEGIISSKFSLAKVDYLEKKYNEALNNLKDALTNSKKYKTNTYLLDIYKYMARTYSKLGNLDGAAKYYESYIVMKDSVFNKQKEEIANKLEIQYQTRLKENEISSLKQANMLKELKLKKTKERNLFIEIVLLGIVAFVILLIRKNKIKFENKIIEFKQKLLRSQMNPHFIFNALATIQGYISKKECDTASSTLQKYASLMRQIIENSREEYVPLQEELDTVQNYLEIQKIRKGSFDYEIIVDDSIDIDEIEVPPMLLQPFIENSIKHAFPENKDGNKITVKIKKEKNGLLYSVMDNGIGFEEAQRLKSKQKTKHKSYAISITEERLSLLYKNKKKIRFEITDLSKIKRNLHGTIVKFYLPLNN